MEYELRLTLVPKILDARIVQFAHHVMADVTDEQMADPKFIQKFIEPSIMQLLQLKDRAERSD